MSIDEPEFHPPLFVNILLLQPQIQSSPSWVSLPTCSDVLTRFLVPRFRMSSLTSVVSSRSEFVFGRNSIPGFYQNRIFFFGQEVIFCEMLLLPMINLGGRNWTG